ncbi:MAG: hypothetical protein M3N18_07820 [Actinomycetota bacterium]|nr:hypothetical protein [Actinomycetota bacterium]
MTPQARIGYVTTVLSFIGGVWLFLAPFIVEYQAVGGWIDATRNDLWTGGVLMAISVLTLFLFLASRCATLPPTLVGAGERGKTPKVGSRPALSSSGHAPVSG